MKDNLDIMYNMKHLKIRVLEKEGEKAKKTAKKEQSFF